MNRKFEVRYYNGKSKIIDSSEVIELIEETEEFNFGPDRVNQILVIKKKSEPEIIWTDEEGLRISESQLYKLVD